MRMPQTVFAAIGATSLLLTQALVAQGPIELGRGIFRGHAVTFQVVDGRAMEGDMDLGPVEELQQTLAAGAKNVRSALSPSDPSFLWPNGVIPYTIDPSIPNPQRVMDAIAMWKSQTPIKLNPRTTETNYVAFTRILNNNSICTSSVGMVGGAQTIGVDDGCNSVNVAHNIGHAVGLYSEQTRPDRDYYITVNPANIDKRYQADYALQVPGSVESGPYDFASIMHLSRTGRALDRNLITTETIPPGMPMDGANVTGLSASDIDAVNRLYATSVSVSLNGQPLIATTITSNPLGLQVMVDGSLITTPEAFTWAAGSTHNVDVPLVQGGGTPTRYQFGRWSDNGLKAHSIVATPDVTVYSANFIRQFQFNYSVSPIGSGTVNVSPVSPDGYYTDGTPLTLTAVPAPTFQFQTWNNPNGLILTSAHGVGKPTISFLVTQKGLNYIGTFVSSTTNLMVVTTDPPELLVNVGGSILPSPRNELLAGGASVTVAAGATVSFGVASTRYVFLGWNDSGAATHTLTMPKTGPTPVVTALYKTQHLVSTAFLGPGTVTVTPSSPDGYYDDGTKIQITAAPSPGAQFTGWSGDASGTALTQTITVNKQIYAQATFQQPFTLSAVNIVNAASFLYTPVSPGEIVTLFGLNIGPPSLVTLTLDLNGNVVTSLASCQVMFDGKAAPLVYVSSGQIAAVVPYEVAGKSSTSVVVNLAGQLTNAVTLPVGTASPALFSSNSSGRGGAAIVHQDSTINGPLNPAAKGSIVLLFGTGEGQTNPAGVDGSVANNLPLPAPVAPVTVLIGGPPGIGVPAQVLYAGAAPGDVAGVLQMDIVIPPNAPSGLVPLSFSVGGTSSYNMTTIAIQ
jgi:uncharacterized protein (TIGR03437 family)